MITCAYIALFSGAILAIEFRLEKSFMATDPDLSRYTFGTGSIVSVLTCRSLLQTARFRGSRCAHIAGPVIGVHPGKNRELGEA